MQDSIAKVLLAIEKQNFSRKDFEILCVDDKSTDNTEKIVKKFKNITYVKLPQNGGNGKAKNTGVQVAKGKILFFVDDHMLLDKNALLVASDLFKKYPDISGICGCYQSLKNTDGNIFRDIRRRTLYRKNDTTKEISSSSFYTLSIGIGAFKKELFQKTLFPEDFGQNSAEDIYWEILQLNQGKKFLYVPQLIGVHDHNLDYTNIIKKLIIEIQGTGDLVYKLLSNKQRIPYLYSFLSYSLLLIFSLFFF